MGARSVSSFVAGLKGNDAVLELVLGQGRILSTRADLSGQASKAVIAVGDPSVMDFVVLSPRQLRLTGRRLGTTDLSITAADGEIVNFEVHVVADLSLLEIRLRSLFPDASLTLSQASGNIVVEGQARSPGQVAHIIQIVTTHVAAITTPIPSTQGGGGGGSFLNAANPNQGDQSQAAPAPGESGGDRDARTQPGDQTAQYDLWCASYRQPDPDSNFAAGAAQGTYRRTEPNVTAADRCEFPGC